MQTGCGEEVWFHQHSSRVEKHYAKKVKSRGWRTASAVRNSRSDNCSRIYLRPHQSTARNNNDLSFPRLASCKLLRSFPAAFPPSVQGSHVGARDVPLTPKSLFSKSRAFSCCSAEFEPCWKMKDRFCAPISTRHFSLLTEDVRSPLRLPAPSSPLIRALQRTHFRGLEPVKIERCSAEIRFAAVKASHETLPSARPLADPHVSATATSELRHVSGARACCT